MEEVRVDVWIRDTLTDNIWFHITDWIDLKEECGVYNGANHERAHRLFQLKVAVWWGQGYIADRYEVVSDDPEKAKRWRPEYEHGARMMKPEAHEMYQELAGRRV